MGFGLWVLFDNQSFIAVLRESYLSNTHTHTPSAGSFSANSHHFYISAPWSEVKRDQDMCLPVLFLFTLLLLGILSHRNHSQGAAKRMFAPNHECDLLLNSAVLSCWESSYAETHIQAEEETCEDRGSKNLTPPPTVSSELNLNDSVLPRQQSCTHRTSTICSRRVAEGGGREPTSDSYSPLNSLASPQLMVYLTPRLTAKTPART